MTAIRPFATAFLAGTILAAPLSAPLSAPWAGAAAQQRQDERYRDPQQQDPQQQDWQRRQGEDTYDWRDRPRYDPRTDGRYQRPSRDQARGYRRDGQMGQGSGGMRGQDYWNRTAQGGQRSGRMQQQGLQPLRGRIVKMKTVDRGDTGTAHLVAQVETRSGDRVVVDLGDVGQWNRDRIGQDEPVMVLGYPARVGNRLVLMADQVSLRGRERRIERARGDYTAERPMQTRQIQGTVQRTDQARVRGAQDPNVMALITTDRGASYVVDLGPARDYRPDALEGKQVSVRGRDVRVKDKIVMLADQFRMEGETYTVMRPALVAYTQMGAGQGGRMPGRQGSSLGRGRGQGPGQGQGQGPGRGQGQGWNGGGNQGGPRNR